MGGEWRNISVDKACRLIVDCVNKTAPSIEYKTPYKMIRTTNVKNGRVDLSNCRFVEKEIFEKWTRRSKVLKNDVILTREAPMGEVGMITENNTIFLGQRLMQYRADPDILEARFLLYSFQSPVLKHQFQIHEGTGSVVSHIRVPDCLKFKLNLPPLSEQKAIAHILGSLDDKIELNRQTNQTLEAMAQALFKSWFVDFEPVIDNALAAGNEIPEVLKDKAAARKALGDKRKALPEDVRGLFPSSFVLSEELGWIPEGWEAKKITDIVETVSETYQLKTVKKIIFLNTGDIIDGRFLHRSYSDVSTLPGQAKKSIQKGDILFSEIRPKNKRFAYVNFNAENYVVSTKLMVLRTNKEFSSLFLYFILKQSNTIDILQKAAESRSGTFPQITFNELSAISLALPIEPDLINFYAKNFLVNYFDQFFKLNDQSITLTSLRDTLLPKLISGELRIPEAEKLVEEAEL